MKITTIPSPFALAKYQYQLILADTGIQLCQWPVFIFCSSFPLV